MVHPDPRAAGLASLLRHFHLPPGCRSPQELRAAYYRLAQQLHPDKNGGSGSKEFGELHEKYLKCMQLLQLEERNRARRSARHHEAPFSRAPNASHFSRHGGASHRSGGSGAADRGRGGPENGTFFCAFADRVGRSGAWSYEEWVAHMSRQMRDGRAAAAAGGLGWGPASGGARGFPWEETTGAGGRGRPGAGPGAFWSDEPGAAGATGSRHPPWSLQHAALAMFGTGLLLSFGASRRRRDDGGLQSERAETHLRLLAERQQQRGLRAAPGGGLREEEASSALRGDCDWRSSALQAGGSCAFSKDGDEAARMHPGAALGEGGRAGQGGGGGEVKRQQEKSAAAVGSEELLEVEEAHRGEGKDHLGITPHASAPPSPVSPRRSVLSAPRYEGLAAELAPSDAVQAREPGHPLGGLPRSGGVSASALDARPLSPFSALDARRGRENQHGDTAAGSSSHRRPEASGMPLETNDLLTKQYRRATVRKRRLRRQRHAGDQEETEETRKKRGLVENHGGADASQGSLPVSYDSRGVPPVDLTRGHRGVHRESRYIHGCGGATGAGYDDYLAEYEVHKASRSAEKSRGGELGRKERSHVWSASEEQDEDRSHSVAMKHIALQDEHEEVLQVPTTVESERAAARAAVEAIGAEFKKNIRARMQAAGA
ncbi:DnaJ domain-containing protein [Besnoitia besnoiti]|uniref:DnaJ domain-containing protein n=1 Tax=Besnoitia besnoiti TaxID=94643 RepID=A0A2A9ML63_BESBE|nr:DnaJ domain-containing protein [Besnoitia besnoiti]PFH36190.1 DnaJ domain-containing protein [Besnoitia besnoiti]